MEKLTREAQLQEVELERTTKQLKEAIAIAGEETAKCKAAKEVIKSLTAQVRWFNLFTTLHELKFVISAFKVLIFVYARALVLYY